eukprot:6569125-Pyramimonas_sp.AAC.1
MRRLERRRGEGLAARRGPGRLRDRVGVRHGDEGGPHDAGAGSSSRRRGRARRARPRAAGQRHGALPRDA